MKVLLSTPFDFACPGGVNAHVHHLDRELREMGHTTRILSPGGKRDSIDDDGHVCRIGTAIPIRANGSTARVTVSPFLNGKVREFLEREKFDVIHLHDPLMPTLHLSVLACSTSVNVGTFHGSSSSRVGFHSWFRIASPFFSRMFRQLHYRIAVSQVTKDFISHYFPADYELIPNGIDYESYGPEIAPSPAFRSELPTVLFVGRFDESRKGFRYLVAAMRQVQDVMPHCRLLVVGPGDQSAFQGLIRRYRLQNVTFTGEIPKEALPGIYATSDVFVAPSTGRESFGIILLEAMASGKPVVAADIDGYRLVARDDQEAILVEPRNPDQLSAAILRVLQNPSLASRLGHAGRKRAEAFSWPTIARRVVECYEGARQRVDGKRPKPATSASVITGTRRAQDRIGDMNAQRPGR